MRMPKHAILLLSLVVPFLAGCDLFVGEAITLPPPPAEALQSNPIASPAPATATALAPEGKAVQGDILFVRDGQLWAIGADGRSERPLTALPAGSVLRDLAVSPDGHYLAFSLNAIGAMALDLFSGEMMTVDEVAAGSVERFVWSPASDAFYYHKLVLDANSIPAASEIWRVTVQPGSTPERIVGEGDGLAGLWPTAPAFALVDGTLVFHQFSPAVAIPGTWLSYSPITGDSVPLFDDYGLWDVSPDSSQALLFRQTDVTPGQQRIPAPLYRAALADRADVIQVSPEGEDSAYWRARFATDGSRIMALRYVNLDDVLHAEAVLLGMKADNSGYEVIQLSPDASAEDAAFSWHGDDGVIVQRLRSGAQGVVSELWLLPLDGSPGRMLAIGEMPLVVGGR